MSDVLSKSDYFFLGLLYKQILPSYFHENCPDYANENVGVVSSTNESFVGVVYYNSLDDLGWIKIKFCVFLGL